MANHGQLLEYSLDPVPDPSKWSQAARQDISHLINFFTAIPKDKVCESSPIELNIVAFGQWNLGRPTGKDR